MMTFSDPTVEAVKAQLSQGLTLQGYCNSVLRQPYVNFSDFSNLSDIQSQINTGLDKAKSHADTYLNGIQNNIISNISNISNFYNLYSAVPVVLPPDATEEQWLSILNAMKSQTDTYITASDGVVNDLGLLNTNLGTDAAFFNKTVSDLNALVNGNEGILADISRDLKSIDKQIAGTIAGTAISALAIVGGGILFVYGAAIPGSSLIGVGMVTAGVAGTVASSLALKSLYDTKADLLLRRSTLTNEVNLVTGIDSNFSQLGTQAGEAMQATTEMRNAWVALNSDLDNLSLNLQNGIINTHTIRELFLTAANETIPFIQQDIDIIKQQMAGVGTAESGEMSVGEYVTHVTQEAA
jgi:non-hemolytic enterotoxin B/C